MTCGKQLGISCFIFSKMKAEAGLPQTVTLSPLLCFDLAFFLLRLHHPSLLPFPPLIPHTHILISFLLSQK